MTATQPIRALVPEQTPVVQRPYEGRKAAMATMHGKERAVAPALLATCGIELVVPRGLDTDALGTFTGEIAREGDMLQTAVAKARLGMVAAGLPLGLASEGSYGHHPHLPFVAAGTELLVFLDDERGLTIHESLIYDDTNYGHVVVSGCGPELDRFLRFAGFPEHGVIVRPNARALEAGPIHKGISNLNDLRLVISDAAQRSKDGMAFVQTDMRACFNPMRMRAIADLAQRLAARIASPCPSCRAPGYGCTGQRQGLPCETCGTPTSMILAEVHGCVACSQAEDRPRPDGRNSADAMWCPNCNP